MEKDDSLATTGTAAAGTAARSSIATSRAAATPLPYIVSFIRAGRDTPWKRLSNKKRLN